MMFVALFVAMHEIAQKNFNMVNEQMCFVVAGKKHTKFQMIFHNFFENRL